MKHMIKYNAMRLATQFALEQMGYSKEDVQALTAQDYDYACQDLEETIEQIVSDAGHMMEIANLIREA
jgi:hypothetical protein